MEMARTSRAEWAKRVERWQDSGLTAKEFAAELDVSANSLTFWKWKLRKVQPGTAAGRVRGKREKLPRDVGVPAKFLRLVPTVKSERAIAALELILPRGVTLRVPRDFDEATLVRLVELLGGR
jgi:transposase